MDPVGCGIARRAALGDKHQFYQIAFRRMPPAHLAHARVWTIADGHDSLATWRGRTIAPGRARRSCELPRGSSRAERSTPRLCSGRPWRASGPATASLRVFGPHEFGRSALLVRSGRGAGMKLQVGMVVPRGVGDPRTYGSPTTSTWSAMASGPKSWGSIPCGSATTSFFSGLGGRVDPYHEAWTTMTAVVMQTERVRVGSMVLVGRISPSGAACPYGRRAPGVGRWPACPGRWHR